jgi:hypothetical protein
MSTRAWPTWALALAVMSQVSCVSAQSRAATSGIDVIEEDTIEAMHATSAYDVVSRTHGEYLHSRGRQSLDSKIPEVPAHVFVDDTYYGDVSTLRTVPASELSEVRFYQGYEAQYKFGSGHMGGVVQLITKR